MAGKRDKPEEIVAKLRQVEVLQGQGQSISDAVRQIGVTQQTYYRWRKQYGGMGRVNSGAKCNTAGRFGICLMHNVKRCRHVELYASHAQRERSDRCLEGRWLKHPSHCGEA